MASSHSSLLNATNAGTNTSNVHGTNYPSANGQVSTVVNRAREILRLNSSAMASTAQQSMQQYPKRRHLGHSYQKPKESKAKQGEEKTCELVCIKPFQEDEVHGASAVVPDYALGKDDIYLSGAVDLTTTDTEEEIRNKIFEVLSTRIPDLTPHDFEFVKVLHKTVITPAMKVGQKFNYKMVKTLMG